MEIQEIQPKLYQHFRKLILAKRLSHAYLFLGGFGNYDMAIWLSQAIFCTEEDKPCGHCRACSLVKNLDFADLHVIEPDGQSIKVEQIRNLLQEFSTSAFESNQKVIIIKQAEKMGTNAANALLKSIEEPESEVYIFLLAENENLLLPTIQSRSQKVNFPKNSAYLMEFLEKKGLLKTDAKLLADISDSTEQADFLSQASWYINGAAAMRSFVKKALAAKDEAFLDIPELVTIFEAKSEQEIAFDLLLVLFNDVHATQLTKNTFEAQKFWRSNVRFQSALESILL